MQSLEFELQRLPVMALWDLGLKGNIAPQPVRLTHRLLDMFVDISLERFLVELDHVLVRADDESEGAFAGVFVCHGDYGCFIYCWMNEELLFDFCGGDLETLWR